MCDVTLAHCDEISDIGFSLGQHRRVGLLILSLTQKAKNDKKHSFCSIVNVLRGDVIWLEMCTVVQN
jgi:hypothetical protein